MTNKRVSFDQEFIFRASPGILYQFLTYPDILVRWFCDAVDIQDEVYTFEWDGSEEEWEMVDDIQEERVKFVISDADEGEYIEFRMYKSDITNETILELTAYADEDEVDEEKTFWENQIAKLKGACGG